MKFCYADESIQTGTASGANEKLTVVAGVIVDAVRMHQTKADWDELLASLENRSNGKMSEVKGRELYRGNAYWREWDSGERSDLIEDIITWMGNRKHALTFGAVSTSQLNTERARFDLDGYQDAGEWCIAAMHLILGVQKQYQNQKNNKGKSLFVFDHSKDHGQLTELLLNPPSSTDDFYSRERKQRQLDQVIDVPYTADSKHVGLIQVADLFAFLLGLYAGLESGLIAEKFDGELDRLGEWMQLVKPVLLPDLREMATLI